MFLQLELPRAALEPNNDPHSYQDSFWITNMISLFFQYYRKIHCLTSEFHVKFHAKNRYRTNREAMSAISVFQVKFNVEFTSQAVNFS